MKTILLIALVLFVAVFVLWRLSSKRYVLPCPSWLSWMGEIDNPFAKEHNAATIIKRLDAQKDARIVDIGCGPGRLTIPLAHAVGGTGSVTAMDIQQKMLEKVKAKAVGLDNITFLHAKLGDNKLEKDVYDYALLVSVLGEIPDQKLALQEIYDALKSGGILSISETVFDPHYQRLSVVKELACNIGFEEKQVFGNWLSYTIHLEAKK